MREYSTVAVSNFFKVSKGLWYEKWMNMAFWIQFTLVARLIQKELQCTHGLNHPLKMFKVNAHLASIVIQQRPLLAACEPIISLGAGPLPRCSALGREGSLKFLL